MSTIKASDVNATTNAVVSELIKTIVSKHVGITDEEKNGKNEKNDYITKDQLSEFGKTLAKEITTAILKSVDTKNVEVKGDKEEDTKKVDTKNVDTENTKTADTKKEDTKKVDTKNVDTENTKTADTKNVDDIVKAVMTKFKEEITGSVKGQRKSYVINDKGSLVKSAGKDTQEIDVENISQEDWNALPKITRDKILSEEFRARMH